MRRKIGNRERIEFHPDGKAPCSSGIRSGRFGQMEAPLAMNRTRSVRIMPYLSTPSSLDQRQQVAPGRLTRDVYACCVAARGDLVDLAEEDDAVRLDAAHRLQLTSSSLTSFAGPFVDEQLARPLIFSFCATLRAPPMFWNMPLICVVSLLHAWRAKIRPRIDGPATSISISLSSNSPRAASLRNFWRVAFRRSIGVSSQVKLPLPAAAGVEDAIPVCILRRACALLSSPLRGRSDGDSGEIADDRFDVAADVADPRNLVAST